MTRSRERGVGRERERGVRGVKQGRKVNVGGWVVGGRALTFSILMLQCDNKGFYLKTKMCFPSYSYSEITAGRCP